MTSPSYLQPFLSLLCISTDDLKKKQS